MGWIFAGDRRHNRQACIEELRRPSRYGEGRYALKPGQFMLKEV